METKRYDLILADPPWQYQNYAAPPGEMHERARGANKHYPTMTLDSLMELPISQLANDDCVLFMWAVWPLIEDAFDLIRAWGFTYKTLAFDWVKWNSSGIGVFVGMGNYTRSNPEPCLLAFNGNPLPVADHAVAAVTFSPVEKHSKKPQEIQDKIERLYPDLSKLELFARRQRDGWDVWGNEVDSDINI
jgi:N6-adenosine-specific RNA methylase IME4